VAAFVWFGPYDWEKQKVGQKGIGSLWRKVYILKIQTFVWVGEGQSWSSLGSEGFLREATWFLTVCAQHEERVTRNREADSNAPSW